MTAATANLLAGVPPSTRTTRPLAAHANAFRQRDLGRQGQGENDRRSRPGWRNRHRSRFRARSRHGSALHAPPHFRRNGRLPGDEARSAAWPACHCPGLAASRPWNAPENKVSKSQSFKVSKTCRKSPVSMAISGQPVKQRQAAKFRFQCFKDYRHVRNGPVFFLETLKLPKPGLQLRTAQLQ